MAAQSDNKKSRFHKSVNLHEWWLIWGEDENQQKGLAIAGHTSRDQQALRIFSSSPILKRHDVYTLETTDGIYVRIFGLINKTRTEENGFPSEVFKCFSFGFPPHWDVCAEHYLAQGFASNDLTREDANVKGCSNAYTHINEMTDARANVSLANTDRELNQDHTACMILRGSRNSSEAVKCITRPHGAKDTSQNELTRETKRSEGRLRSRKDPNAAMEKSTHEPKRSVRRPRSKKSPKAATEKLTHERKRSVGRPKSKDPDAAKEKKIKSSRRR